MKNPDQRSGLLLLIQALGLYKTLILLFFRLGFSFCFSLSFRFGFPLGKVTGVGTIVEVGAAPYVAWEGKVAGVEAIHGFRFDATAGGTEVLSRHEFYGARALLASLLFLTRRVHKIYQAALEGFKAYVEVGTIQLKMPV